MRGGWIVGGLAAGGLSLVGLFVVDWTSAPPEARSVVPAGPVADIAADVLPVPAPPIENWLEPRAEGIHKQRRKAWFRQLHQAPPGVDWEAIDRANGLARVEARSRRATLRDGIAPVTGWVERGSDNQSGRAHVAAHSTNGSTLYLGSALGGVWKGSPDGEDWTPIGDNLYGGAHHLVVFPGADATSPDVVLAATQGGLIHASTDDGATWIPPIGLPWAWGNSTLIKTSDGSEAAFLVRRNSDGVGVYRTTDAGRSFEAVRDCGMSTCDIWTSRTGDGRLYLADGGELLVSDDLGDSWELRGSLGTGDGDLRLAGSEAGAPRLYAMWNGTRLIRSDDAGATWEPVFTDVSDYWGRLAASIRDPDLVAWGGVEVHYSTDGGASFGIVNPWWAYYDDIAGQLHADIMGLHVVPDGADDEIWYISTDGGPYRSLDQLETVENLSMTGLRISQYYSTLTSVANPEHIAAGAQDQGFQRTQGVVQDDALLEFEQTISGDYGHLTSGDGTHDTLFSVYPGFILAYRGEDTPQSYSIGYPPDEDPASIAWLPPITADPDETTSFYFPGVFLWRYDFVRELGSWTAQRWSNERFGASAGEYVTAIEFSPVDSDRVYLATNMGRLFWSNDHGVTWRESDDIGPGAHYFYGHALHASEQDRQVAVVGGSGYGQTAVWRTTNGGRSWEPWDTGLGETHVYDIEEAPDGSGRLFAGTQQAAYLRSWDGSGWVDITEDVAPITIYWTVEALMSENTMRFGTYGRGIWDYQLDAERTGCFPVQDYDQDGVLCTQDCDDNDDTRFPGAPEVCDAIDTNCDDAEELDLDGDGFIACEDCDDDRADVFPGAEEVVGDDIDQDCDGEDRRCGCSTQTGPGIAWLALGLGLVSIRRRR